MMYLVRLCITALKGTHFFDSPKALVWLDLYKPIYETTGYVCDAAASEFNICSENLLTESVLHILYDLVKSCYTGKNIHLLLGA